MNRAFVLLSGGLDSTTALHMALGQYDGVEAVSINYGQRHKKETQYARRMCNELNIKFTVLELNDILSGVMLTDKSIDIPNTTYDKIVGVSPTYVPFRNGLMLSMIAAHAQKWITANTQPGFLQPNAGIYFGAHAEDAHNWAYPDCTPEFIGAMANAIHVGTYFAVRLHTPLMWMQKSEIVRLGTGLGIDYSKTWSCYAGGDLHCGTCPTCHARKQAFGKAGVPDPTEYEVRGN
jgi:7-cyano-7-deazaguanine synthase